MNQHLVTIGLEARGGRVESAPNIDSLECHTDAWKYKRVRFHGMVQVISIQSEGKGRPVDRTKRAQWRACGGDGSVARSATDSGTSSSYAAQGELGSKDDLGVVRHKVSETAAHSSSIGEYRRRNS